MRLSSDDGLGRLELDVFDLELESKPPRIAVWTRVKMQGYAGERKAWIEIAAIRRFAMELEALRETPNGAAVLDASEPDAMQLTVLPMEDGLESTVHLSLQAAHKVGTRSYTTSLNGAFSLPSSEIRRFAATMRRWTDEKFLSELEAWGFDEKALLDE